MSHFDRETTAGFRSLGDAAANGLQDMLEKSGVQVGLRSRVGKGGTVLDFGMARVREHALALGMNSEGVEYVERRARETYSNFVHLLESPIERAMFAALLTGRWFGCETIPPAVHNSASGSVEMLPPGDIVIVPQLAFVKFRLDFGVVVEKDGRRQIVDVECDGADFHKDASKERFRTAYLQSWNIPTFRFKGSELHEDAIRAADEVIASICHWRAH